MLITLPEDSLDFQNPFIITHLEKFFNIKVRKKEKTGDPLFKIQVCKGVVASLSACKNALNSSIHSLDAVGLSRVSRFTVEPHDLKGHAHFWPRPTSNDWSIFWLSWICINTQQTFISSKSTTETLEKMLNMFRHIKTSEQRQWRCYDVFIVNFDHLSHLFLVFLLMTLNWKMSATYTKISSYPIHPFLR